MKDQNTGDERPCVLEDGMEESQGDRGLCVYHTMHSEETPQCKEHGELKADVRHMKEDVGELKHDVKGMSGRVWAILGAVLLAMFAAFLNLAVSWRQPTPHEIQEHISHAENSQPKKVEGSVAATGTKDN